MSWVVFERQGRCLRRGPLPDPAFRVGKTLKTISPNKRMTEVGGWVSGVKVDIMWDRDAEGVRGTQAVAFRLGGDGTTKISGRHSLTLACQVFLRAAKAPAGSYTPEEFDIDGEKLWGFRFEAGS